MRKRPEKRPIERGDLAGLLRGHGISATPQRIEIAAVMLETKQHLSAEQVLARLARGRAAASKATVYNTLGLFAERGLVREVIVDATRVFYDSNTAEHHHFYNVDDGTLTDMPPGAVAIGELPEAPPGTRTDSVDIVVRVRNDA